MDIANPYLEGHVNHVMYSFVTRHVWKHHAAQRYRSSGLEDGAVNVANNCILRWRKDYKVAGIVSTIAQGVLRPQQRLIDNGYDFEQTCRLCDRNTENFLRMFWEYPCIEDLPDVVASSHHVGDAIRGIVVTCFFCLLGTVPAKWTRARPELLIFQPAEHISPLLLTSPNGATESPFICVTHGAGGLHNQDARLRRIGFGVAKETGHCTVPPRCKSGGVPEFQTAPRAELMALAEALQYIRGYARAYSDSLYVCKGFWRSRARKHVSHGGLWLAVWGFVWLRSVKVFQIKSHISPSELHETRRQCS